MDYHFDVQINFCSKSKYYIAGCKQKEYVTSYEKTMNKCLKDLIETITNWIIFENAEKDGIKVFHKKGEKSELTIKLYKKYKKEINIIIDSIEKLF